MSVAGGLSRGIERALKLRIRALQIFTKTAIGPTFDELAAIRARILRDARFRRVPKVLETPKGKDGVVMDRRNLAFLRRLACESMGGMVSRAGAGDARSNARTGADAPRGAGVS